MAAPRYDQMTAPQHWFSKSGWSQLSETAFKVCDICRAIKLQKFSPWPTGYKIRQAAQCTSCLNMPDIPNAFATCSSITIYNILGPLFHRIRSEK